MTLLTDLQAIDLSSITSAKATIGASISGDEIQNLVKGGVTAGALGDFGAALTRLQGALDEPTSLVKPLVDAVAPLGESLVPDMAVFDRYRGSVEAGANVLGGLVGTLASDPALFGQTFGRSLADSFGAAAQAAEHYLPIDLGDLANLREIVERVDAGLPPDPAQFAELALDVLSPFPRSDLVRIRTELDRGLQAARGVHVDVSLSAPLVAAFDAVAAAQTQAQLRAALADLKRVQATVVAAIRAEYGAAASTIAALPIDGVLKTLASVGATIRRGEQDILRYLEDWRNDIARARELIESGDPAALAARVLGILDELEAHARAQVLAVFDRAIEQLKSWVQGLLAELRLRAIRNEVRDFLFAVAAAIRDAHLDAVANEATSLLAQVRAAVDAGNLADAIKAALADVEKAVSAALDGVIGALETIGSEIGAVADEAGAILARAATVLGGFKVATDGIAASVEGLGVEEAAAQVIDHLRQLRETVEKLLTAAPLPEPLRDQVNQLAELVQGIDVEAIFSPVRDAVAELKIPDDVVVEVTASLHTLESVVANIVPAELVASIEEEVNAVLEPLRSLDPSVLLKDVTSFIAGTADAIDGVSVASLVNGIAGPFDAVLATIDELHPRRLLAPVIDAYDGLIGKLPSPSPGSVVDRAVGTVATAGDAVSRAAATPTTSVLPSMPAQTGAAPLPAPAAALPQEATLPGDFVRLVGHLPNAVREALASLEAGPAGEVMAAIDGMTGGLARDIRAIAAEVAAVEVRLEGGLDDLLAPLAVAQSTAQLAIRARFAGTSFNVDSAMRVTADAGPGSVRAAVLDSAVAARGKARALTVGTGGGVSVQLGEMADLLEQSSLGRLAGDLDAFLAALDPEPIAKELDALVLAVMKKIPETIAAVGDTFAAAIERIASLMEELNPGTQAHRFLEVLTVVQEELDLLNPRRLAAELGEIHAAIRAAVAAYDPRRFAAEIDATLDAIAASLRGLSPADLLGNLDFLKTTIDRVEGAIPSKKLEGIGTSLTEVGATLHDLDLAALVDAVEALGPRVIDSFEKVVVAVRNELVALLESLRYSSGGASASASVSVGGQA
jgi:hypothetical protein